MLKISFSSKTHFSSKPPAEYMSRCSVSDFIAVQESSERKAVTCFRSSKSQGLIALPKFVQQLARAHDVTLQVHLPLFSSLPCVPLADFVPATSIS